MADQADGVALGVADEGHPFLGADRARGVVVVGEDHVRFGADLDPVLPAALDRLGDVGDPR